MTGQELYEMYVDVMLEQGCGLDSWEDLSDVEQAAWSALASRIG